MSIRFSADEVFTIAEQIERNGAAFYRKAAELHPTRHNQEFLLKLAGMEDTHLEVFQAMHRTVSAAEREPATYDPYDESMLYLQAMADMHGGEGSPHVMTKLDGTETMRDVVRIALQLEAKSILFYVGMKKLAGSQEGVEKLDKIISEEKSHVVILSDELKALTPGA
jgi:rubrerythrin